MEHFIRTVAPLFLLVIFGLSSYPSEAGGPKDTISVQYLSNGLPVVFAERFTSPNVVIYLVVNGGSGAEGDMAGIGLAHFAEHLLADELTKWAENQGMPANAYTGTDDVGYYLQAPSSRFAEAINVFGRSVSKRVFSEQTFENEKRAVLEEIARRKGDQTTRLYERLEREVYRVHPYGLPGAGDQDATALITRSHFESYLERRFVAGNMVLVIAGAVAPSQAMPFLEKAFGSILRGPYAPPFAVIEPPMLYPRDVVEATDEPLAGFARAWRIPDLYHPDVPALDVLALVLSGGDTSRFYRTFIETGRTSDIGASSSTPRGPGLFVVLGQSDEHARQEILADAGREIASMAKQGPTEAELGRVRSMLRRAYARRTETLMGLAGDIASHYLYHGTIAGIGDVSRHEKVTRADVARVARKYLSGVPAATVTFIPRAKMHVPVEASPHQSDGAIRRIGKRGAVFLGFSDPALSHGNVDLYLVYDRSRGVPRPGTEELLSALLARGSMSQSSREFSEAFSRTGGTFSAVYTDDFLHISLRDISSEALPLALRLAKDAIMHPRIRDADIEAERKILLFAVRQADDDGWTSAKRRILARKFPGHPYGSWVRPDDVPLVTRDDITQAASMLRTPAKIVVVATGGLHLDRVFAWSETLFSPSGTLAWSEPPVPESSGQDVEQFVMKKPTAHVVFAARIPPVYRSALGSPMEYHPDFMPLKIALKVLDGRIEHRARTERGISYDQGAFVMMFPRANLACGYIEVAEQSHVSVAEILLREEFARLVQEPISDAEFDRARKALATAIDIASETAAARASFAAWKEIVAGNGLDIRDRYLAELERVSPIDAFRTAQVYLAPDQLTLVVQGMEPLESK